MVRVAEHAASPALLAALQVYCPACSEKASTMMSMAVFDTSSKWNTTFLVGWTGCRLRNQLISGFGMPDTHAWKRATSPCGTVQLVIGWMKTGFWPKEGFFRLVRLVETCHWDSAQLSTVCFCPERKHDHWLYMFYWIYIHSSQHSSNQVWNQFGTISHFNTHFLPDCVNDDWPVFRSRSTNRLELGYILLFCLSVSITCFKSKIYYNHKEQAKTKSSFVNNKHHKQSNWSSYMSKIYLKRMIK